jgi:hypothetical protein
MKYFSALLFIVFFSFPLAADDSWILPTGSVFYREAEEIFISGGRVPPLEERPVTAQHLKRTLNEFILSADDLQAARSAQLTIAKITQPFPVFSPILETAVQLNYTNETGRLHRITSNDSYKLIDYLPMYDVGEVPSIITFGFSTSHNGFSLLFQPELRAAVPSLPDDKSFSNFPVDIILIDLNFPYRGIAGYYKPPVEFRFGRDKLHVGVGQHSTLLLSECVPYFDYIKAGYFVDRFSLSVYAVGLDATITAEESVYLDAMYTDDTNPEGNASANGKSFVDRYKTFVVAKAVFYPWPWISLSATQTNLIGGRVPWLYDLNPLGIFHNTYSEGVYSVPITVSCVVTPAAGIRVYGEFLLYDLVLGDENDITENPSAAAFQTGFTLLSNPYFQLGPGRFRLDGEYAITSPWVYGKYYNLRKFTSRIIYMSSFSGRYWVDYPLGFYLGPDSVDYHLSLSYGIPGEWECELHYNRSGQGSIDLYGFGDGNDYSHIGEEGYPLRGAPTGLVLLTDKITLSADWYPRPGLELSGWYTFKAVKNRFHEEGNDDTFHSIGITAGWKIY